ncbi:YlbD family protein [Cytobacillus suaedae]|nr:YlbD family protein [Cytobacillus suaedae]
MSRQQVHPSIVKFKEFVKEHPQLIQEVRAGKKSWQEVYEDWYLLGESDKSWEKYKSNQSGSKSDSNSESKKDFMSQIFTMIKNVDMNQFQQQISNAGSAISTIQSVISQFQGGNTNNTGQQPTGGNHPFSFRKD